MDGFEFNKIAGAVLASLLVILGGNKILSAVYAPVVPEKKSYVVEGVEEASTQTASAAPDAAAPEVPLPELLAKATPEAGEKITRQCISCHSFEKGGPNKTGPNLFGVLGKPYAHLEGEGYNYSDAFKAEHAKGRVWDYEGLFHYLKDPRAWVPGNKMSFAGLRKPEQRADVIVYLRSLMDNPPPLPKAESAPAAPAPAAQ